jgi:hypothetical protein
MRGDPLRVARPGPCRCYGGVPYTSAFEMKSQLGLTRSDDRTEDCACGADDDVIPSPAHVQKATISDDRSQKGSRDTDAHGGDCAARSEITDEIQNSITNGREPELSEKSQKHLITCASCRSELPFWLDLARAAREIDEEDEMIWAAEGGDPAIAQRSVAGGLALFKPSVGADGRSLMLIVDPNDWMDVRSVHRDVTR